MPHSRKASNPSRTNCGHPAPVASSDCLNAHYLTQESQVPDQALARRLDGWPWHADMVHYQLGFSDFERAAKKDDATVRQALKAACITAGT